MNQPSRITIEWRYDKRLLIVTLKENSRGALEEWARTMKDILSAQPERSQPGAKMFYVLHDMSAMRFPQATQTPKYGQQVSDIARNRLARVVIVVSSSILVQLANLFFSGQRTASTTKIVASREEGLQWLSMMAEDDGQPFKEPSPAQ